MCWQQLVSFWFFTRFISSRKLQYVSVPGQGQGRRYITATCGTYSHSASQLTLIISEAVVDRERHVYVALQMCYRHKSRLHGSRQDCRMKCRRNRSMSVRVIIKSFVSRSACLYTLWSETIAQDSISPTSPVVPPLEKESNKTREQQKSRS
jgi:hypothetical protein